MLETSNHTSSWFACYHPRPEAKLRLIGFPHGGGGPQAFREWGKLLSDDIELLALSLPGRGSRLDEPLITSTDELVPQVIEGLSDYFDKPFVLFGHSAGALMAFEVTRQLQEGGYPLPLHLFVSAHKAPYLPPDEPLMYKYSDAELLSLMSELGMVPEEVAKHPKLLELILPPLKADFEVSETYRWQQTSAVSVPLTALGGRYDELATAEDLDRWAASTTLTFELAMFDGDHFYTQSHQAEVVAFIAQSIEATVATLPKSIMRGERLPYPQKCLHELLREQAAKTPDAVAVVGSEMQLTFRELDEQSDLLARYLQSQGVGLKDLVGIYMETSVEYVIAFFAALKAGGAYMTVEIAYPEALLQQVLNSAQPVVLLTKASPEAPGKRFYARLSEEWQRRAFKMDEGWVEQLDSEPIIVPDNLPLPTIDSPAQCVMSSGTTGTPKGIICPHRSAVNSYYWRYVYHPYQAGEREACNVFLVWEVARPILQGYPAYIIPDEIIYDPLKLVDYLSKHRITRILFTPSLLEQILNTPNLDLQDKLRHLRVVYLNGEVVTTVLRNRFRALFPDVLLLNDYSTAEAHDTCHFDLAELDPIHSPKYSPIGRPMSNVNLYVLDENQKPVPQGFRGELYVGGESVGHGYLNQPEKTAQRFPRDPFVNDGSLMFRSGDAGRILPNGQLEIQGRIAFMVKLRGYTVVPSAVETTIIEHPAINTAVVITQNNEETGQPEHLVAYIVGDGQLDNEMLLDDLRSYLKQNLPHYAIPSYIIPLDELPIAANGKLDRKRLPKPDKSILRPVSKKLLAPPESQAEKALAEVWKSVLDVESVELTDNFFDLGGHSLLAAELCSQLREALSLDLSVVDLFQYPTLRALAQSVSPQFDTSSDQAASEPISLSIHEPRRLLDDTDIAIIGMAGRFPGADNVEQFWENLRDGVCSIRQLTDEELERVGIPPEVYQREDYIKVGAILEGVDQFDPNFWGISKREATVMDPQQRLFLESCWQALESAGYPPSQKGERTGVFAGCFLPFYLLHYLHGGGLMDPTDAPYASLTEFGNDKDYLATRVSYLLNLRGPSISVQTSCSTGLVAIATACQALLAGQCDMALAGASSITFPQAGYQYVEGFLNSRDGVCRAFDAEASGTILGDGVGVVVLKRLEDAKATGDHILAVIKGYAINNDGKQKAAYAAPSVQGQAKVVASALAMAGVSADTISYIEAHGTGTLVGDPIEVRALSTVFRQSTDRTGYCALGSVKPNIGHSNIAAGMAGLMKTVLALQHRQLPPSINFKTPNPRLELERTPFYVNDQLRDWESEGALPRRAGVTSLGIGGTNCHIVLEEWVDEAPQSRLPSLSRHTLTEQTHHLLTLSAKTPDSVEQNRLNLIEYLQSNPEVDMANVAYTLQRRREAFPYRLAVTAHDAPSAVRALTEAARKSPSQTTINSPQPSIVFMFSGAGGQYTQMGQGLYNQVPTFCRYFDECRELLQPLLGVDLRALLYGENSREELKQFDYLNSAMFAVEYSLARTLQDWGLQPSAIVGHSLSEYVAACLAGVLRLPDALALVVTRSTAMGQIGIDGAMLAVKMSQEEAEEFLARRDSHANASYVGLAVINSPTSVVLSGHRSAILEVEQELKNNEVMCRRVKTAKIASHSPLMRKAVDLIDQKAHAIDMHAPTIPLALNLTGNWQPDNLSLEPSYWGQQALSVVRFEHNIRVILQQKPDVMLEIGPGRGLTRVVTEIINDSVHSPLVLPTMRHRLDTDTADPEFLLQTLGQLWEAGIDLDWQAIQADLLPQARRIPLPTYAFDKQRCWPGLSPGTLDQRLSNRLLSRPTAQNGSSRGSNPLLGRRLHSVALNAGQYQFESQLASKYPAYLAEHRLYGKTILPATAYLEMAFAAGAVIGERFSLADVLLEQALVFPDSASEGQTVQTLLTPEGTSYAFQIFSLSLAENGEASWTRHASGKLRPTTEASRQVDLATLQERCRQSISVERFYQPADEQIRTGASFQYVSREVGVLSELWYNAEAHTKEESEASEREAFGRIQVPERLLPDMLAYHIHPALLDACLQVMWGLFSDEQQTEIYLPVAYEQVILFRAARDDEFFCHAQLDDRETDDGHHAERVNLDLFDREGRLVASIIGATVQCTESCFKEPSDSGSPNHVLSASGEASGSEAQLMRSKDQRTVLLAYIRQEVAQILGLDSADLIDQHSFFRLGMDSLTSLELRNRLQSRLGCRLPATLIFKYPTVAALADQLAQQTVNSNQ